MERRLIGVLIISLIVGSLISLYLIREKIETPINLIDDSFPKRALAGTSEVDQDKYGVAFICREDLKQVAVRFAYLMESEPSLTEPSTTVADPEKAGEMIEQINNKLVLIRESGYEPEISVSDIEIDNEKGTLVIYDFSSKLNPMLPSSGSSYFRTIYAVFLNKSKMINRYYEGVSDFFFMRGVSLQALEITRNANKTTYVVADEEVGLQPGVHPITQAPEQGKIVFSDLKRNDRVSIVYRTISRYVQYPSIFARQIRGKYLIHIVKFEIDGEMAEDKILVHVIENGASREV